MKIKHVRVRRLTGTVESDGPIFEERLVRPIDIYPEFRNAPFDEGGTQIDARHMRIVADFLEIESDDGVVGRAGPIAALSSHLILDQLVPLLVGKDPLAIELLWDQMHRRQVHGRQGHMMIAISAVDCALWDLKGLAFGQPIWRILGGPTRDEVPLYASMLGFEVNDLGKVRERALRYKELGYRAQKWFFRHGPMSGHEGMHKNVALVRTVREAVGDDYDIMFDCWQSFDLDYAADLCRRIEQYRPRWLEECFMPDRVDTHVKLKALTHIPLSGGEHEYTRWGFRRLIEKDAFQILQPDIYWSGGFSEVLKIAAYATVHDLITIPHGHSTPATIHFSVSQSPIHTPYQEFLVNWNRLHMHFLKDPTLPENGMLKIPQGPGIGMALDPDKIEKEEEVRR